MRARAIALVLELAVPCDRKEKIAELWRRRIPYLGFVLSADRGHYADAPRFFVAEAFDRIRRKSLFCPSPYQRPRKATNRI